MKSPGKIQLANIPTPVQEIVFEGRKFLIKRDDLTGAELSGNKVRKLEYLLYQARKEKARYLFTCGGDQSNHARATAIAAAKLGMKSKLFLWGRDKPNADGNLFLDKLTGAEIFFMNKKNYDFVNEIMQEESEILRKKGTNVYVIPEGGSTTLGIQGYVSFIDELSLQINFKQIDGILLAAGTGGTAAGIMAGLSQRNSNIRVYAVNVLYNEYVIRKKILQLAQGAVMEFNPGNEINPDNLSVLNGYSEEGYKRINRDKVELVNKLFRETGILLDPAYTGKAFYAYYHKFLLKQKKSKVLFLHTGGLFGVFGRKMEYLAV